MLHQWAKPRNTDPDECQLKLTCKNLTLCYSPAVLEVEWVGCDRDTSLQTILCARFMCEKPPTCKKVLLLFQCRICFALAKMFLFVCEDVKIRVWKKTTSLPHVSKNCHNTTFIRNSPGWEKLSEFCTC
jgi:hypothetical protein